jgi:hypothetical protein
MQLLHPAHVGLQPLIIIRYCMDIKNFDIVRPFFVGFVNDRLILVGCVTSKASEMVPQNRKRAIDVFVGVTSRAYTIFLTARFATSHSR